MRNHLLLPLLLVVITHSLAAEQNGRSSEKLMNIVFIMVDDLGYNDVPWTDSRMYMPNILALAENHAVRMNRSYVNWLCSATRSAFFTGFDPYRIGTQRSILRGQEATGVPTDFRYFTQELKEAGYMNYMVGKWHLGFCKNAYLPTSRGFDAFRGMKLAVNYYYSHQAYGGGYDFWKQLKPDNASEGVYSTWVYRDQALEHLEAHQKNYPEKPFFLYFASQAPHSPLQPPSVAPGEPKDKYTKHCMAYESKRRTYCGIVQALDEAVGNVVDKLKELGVYDDTMIMFTSDNGADIDQSGSNWPLRGQKQTLYEGGCRTNTFVHSSRMFPEGVQHKHGLMHIVDWFKTIVEGVAKRPIVQPFSSKFTSQQMDGLNQWPYIMGEEASPRNYVVYNINHDGAAIGVLFNGVMWKLITGSVGDGMTSDTVSTAVTADRRGWYMPGSTTSFDADGRVIEPNDGRDWLYNLDEDQSEIHNLATQRPEIVAAIKAKIAQLKEDFEVADLSNVQYKEGDPALMGGVWGNWCENIDPPPMGEEDYKKNIKHWYTHQ